MASSHQRLRGGNRGWPLRRQNQAKNGKARAKRSPAQPKGGIAGTENFTATALPPQSRQQNTMPSTPAGSRRVFGCKSDMSPVGMSEEAGRGGRGANREL